MSERKKAKSGIIVNEVFPVRPEDALPGQLTMDQVRPFLSTKPYPRPGQKNWLEGVPLLPEDELAARVVIDPAIRDGTPCVRGSPATVGEVLARLADGQTPEQVARELRLEYNDIRACLLFASKRAAQP